MDRKILKRVGEGGSNLHQDVVTVQELLNGVSPEQGGARPLLKVDGICGPKTKHGIQVFQLKHFGWKLADARVDPEGATLRKLNELSVGPNASNAYMLYQGKRDGYLRRDRAGDWFFRIEQVSVVHPFPEALFWFGPPGMAPSYRPSPAQFVGVPWALLRTSRRCGVAELAGPGLVRRQRRKSGPPSDFTEFHSGLAHGLKYDFSIAGGLDPSEPPGPGIIVYDIGDYTLTEYHGQLQAVG